MVGRTSSLSFKMQIYKLLTWRFINEALRAVLRPYFGLSWVNTHGISRFLERMTRYGGATSRLRLDFFEAGFGLPLKSQVSSGLLRFDTRVRLFASA